MSGFDFSTLITDRTQADVSALSALMEKKLETWTDEELEQFNNGLLKGGYWWTDLNRVTACMEYINRELQELGYETGYKPVVVHPGVSPEEPNLPDGYIQLEYIESTGKQYINTNILANQDSKIRAKIAFLGASGENILGVRNTSTDVMDRLGLITFGSTNKIGCFFGKSSAQTIPIDSNPHEYDLNKSGILVDGVVYSFPSSTFSTSYPVVLFGFNNGKDGVVKTKSRIWNFDMDGHHFIPCKNPSEVAGMYDIVEGEFYSSLGTAQFAAGPEAIPEPKPEPLDPYTWYKEDIPTLSQMEQYLSNVAALRSVFKLPDHAPQTPKSMVQLTTEKANDIESVLKEVENVIILIISSFWYSGELYSGEV